MPRTALAATAAATIFLGSLVSAEATIVTFSSFGGSFPLYTVPPDETLYTDFSGGDPGTGDGSLYTPSGSVQTGDQPGSFVAAPFTSTGSAPGQFFAVTPGESETFTFASPQSDVGLYIGSLDAENTLVLHTISGDVTFTGTDLAAVSGAGLPGNGFPTITGSVSNGRFLFVDGSNDILGITVSEATSARFNSFEIGQITTSDPIPEPSTWAMMLLGLAGLGLLGYRSGKRVVRQA
jgi:PEP-CTERM motif